MPKVIVPLDDKQKQELDHELKQIEAMIYMLRSQIIASSLMGKSDIALDDKYWDLIVQVKHLFKSESAKEAADWILNHLTD
jgi:hypothetical protein